MPQSLVSFRCSRSRYCTHVARLASLISGVNWLMLLRDDSTFKRGIATGRVLYGSILDDIRYEAVAHILNHVLRNNTARSGASENHSESREFFCITGGATAQCHFVKYCITCPMILLCRFYTTPSESNTWTLHVADFKII